MILSSRLGHIGEMIKHHLMIRQIKVLATRNEASASPFMCGKKTLNGKLVTLVANAAIAAESIPLRNRPYPIRHQSEANTLIQEVTIFLDIVKPALPVHSNAIRQQLPIGV